MKDLRILIANTQLPSKKIGSWTTRITKFIINNPTFFTEPWIVALHKAVVNNELHAIRNST